MNCEECLKQLSTVSTREIERTDAWQHSASCPDCARIVRVLTESEDEFAATLDATTSQVPADLTTRRAIALAHRRKVTRRLSLAFAGLAAGIIWMTISRWILPSGGGFGGGFGGSHNGAGLQTVTLEIRCLKNEQARDLILPYMQSNGSGAIIPSSELSVVTVRGTSDELGQVKDLMQRFDVAPAEKCPIISRGRVPPN